MSDVKCYFSYLLNVGLNILVYLLLYLYSIYV